MSGWIEGKPTETGHYWVFDKVGSRQMAYLYKGARGVLQMGSAACLNLENVTHHMPVARPDPPTPPTEMVPKPEVSLEFLSKRLSNLEDAFYVHIHKGMP